MNAKTLKPNEIYLLGKRLRLRQPEGGFRPGLDSVMLAAACPVKEGESILDLGCGVGSAGFCILARVPGAILTGIDIQSRYIELAKENAALNNFDAQSTFHCENITDFSQTKFDHVIANPPFMEDGKHTPSPDESRAMANAHMDKATLEDWVKAAFDTAKSGGSLTMIHRADMVDKIIQALGKSFGATEIIPLWPKAGMPAKRVIIRTIKHRKSPAHMHPGIILHESDGAYTKEAERLLQEAKALN